MSKERLPKRDVQLSDELYLRFRDLLRTRCGLFYSEHKRDDLAHGLQMVLNSTDHSDLVALYADAVGGGATWESILAQLTVGETYFFRNKAQFDVLRQHIFPEVIARRASIRSLRVWSAGCATGEEPYSLAMTLYDLLAEQESWHTMILATDINATFLARAREALYGEWAFRETSKAARSRFFHQEGERWRLNDVIRRTVTFARLNLVEPCYPSAMTGTGALDLIICRNVTIYFDGATTQQIVKRFFEALTPGGWLIVGHAEPQASIYQQFELHNLPNTVVYRKPLSLPPFVATSHSFDLPPYSLKTVPLPFQSPRSTTSLTEQAVPLTPMLESPASRNITSEATPDRPLERPMNEVPLAMARRSADRGEWSTAEEHCRLVLDRDPLCIDAHYLLAQIYEHQGRSDAALAAYRRTIYLDRDYVPGIIGMAHIWRQIGDVANARRSYENALQCLERLPLTALVAGIEGGTTGALAALVSRHIEMLG